MSRASRNDATAAPSTWLVCARPASVSEPVICSASSAATAIPAAMANPPRPWATTKVPIVRRWT